MTGELDLLVSRYLDSTAGREDMLRLDEIVRLDPEARRALLLAAAQDVRLRELLSAGPALESRILPRRRRRSLAAGAAAAALLLAAGGAALLAGRYPAPRVSGSYRIAGGGEVRRGSVITAGAPSASVTLGGYCRVALQPGSTLRIEGRKRAEEVFLERGTALCEADRGVGSFAVRTAVGRASVEGTRFTVRILEDPGGGMFEKRMVVRVLAGAVLVGGGWGGTLLRAGQEAALPPPEAAVKRILLDLGLTDAERERLARALSPRGVAELRERYRLEGRRLLFEAARGRLRAAMPELMPKKVGPEIRAIRRKHRAGPPSQGALTRLILVVQKRARRRMMNVLNDTADLLVAEALADDRLIAWLLAKRIRAEMGRGGVAAFDAALGEAGISDREPLYVARAEGAVDAAIEAYDPDISDLVDPATGRIVVAEDEPGVPRRDEELEARVAGMLRDLLAGLDLPRTKRAAVEATLRGERIDAERVRYCIAVRARLFDAARGKQQDLLPRVMPERIQARVAALRTRARAGGPPSDADLARVRDLVTKRTRRIMMLGLHDIADALAVKAAGDERLVAAWLARQVLPELPPGPAAAFAAALQAAGLAGDESVYLAEAGRRVERAVATYDPDLAGIVDPATGEVVAGEEDR